MKKTIYFIIGLLLLASAAGCSIRTNGNPPYTTNQPAVTYNLGTGNSPGIGFNGGGPDFGGVGNPPGFPT